MQEFSLHAGLSAADLTPTLAHLINLCSSPSTPYAEFVMNFGPKKTTRPVAHHYIRLITSIDPSGCTIPDIAPAKPEADLIEVDATDPHVALSSEDSWVSKQKWSIQYQDTPDAAKRPTTTRTVLTAPVYHGKPIQFLDKLNHEFHYEYILKGHRLIHNDIIITLFQIFKPCTPHEIKDGVEAIDPSSGWILQAAVNVENATEQPLVGQALEELKQLKTDLSQSLGLELEVVDRMLLDTRTRAPGQP